MSKDQPKTPNKAVPPAREREAKTPPSPNEGRLGPAGDPVEGKRDQPRDQAQARS